MLVLPLLTTNMQEDKVSQAERRKLASRAELYEEDGTINGNFTSDFETWINDNIGMRSKMVTDNARILYYLFDVLPDNSDKILGPKGEFNYATPEIIADYQHFNLYSDEQLHDRADAIQYLSDYVEKDGNQFYYYQCWDKHSIYPEYFPDTVLQYGSESKTDGIVKALREYSNVKVVSPKNELLREKARYDTYSRWGDSTHWSQRGAYIGYTLLMDTINSNSSIQYNVLAESDYNITKPDQGMTLFGGIHKTEYLDKFEIKDPKAVLTNEKLSLYAEDQRHCFFTNEEANNKTRLLVIGDSYFKSFIIDDLAESFYETIIIWGDCADDVKNVIDTYDADIVIVENAERCDRTGKYISGVNTMKEQEALRIRKQPL